jgi:glucose/arabinose dehydrogenase
MTSSVLLSQRFTCGVLVGLCSLVALVGSAHGQRVKREAWTTSRIKGTPEPPEPYRLVPAFPKLRFERPTCIEELPGGERLLITEIGGKVFTFRKSPDVDGKDLVVDLAALVPQELRIKGVSLFDAALHPKFAENHYLYLCYVHPAGHTRVSRFTLTKTSPPTAVPDGEQVVITWPSGGLGPEPSPVEM